MANDEVTLGLLTLLISKSCAGGDNIYYRPPQTRAYSTCAVNAFAMTLKRCLLIYISLFCFTQSAVGGVSLPSSWMLFHPQEDGHLPMGMSFMTCTWKGQEQKLSDCDNSDLSYGGVTNFDIHNSHLRERDNELVVPFVRSYIKFPYCLSTTLHSYGNMSYVLSIISNVVSYATNDQIVFLRSSGNYLIKWSMTSTYYDIKFSVYCLSAMPSNQSPFEYGADNGATESLPSAWFFVDPVSDAFSPLGMSFVVCAWWDATAAELVECEDIQFTYGGWVNMDPSRAEVIYESDYEMLHVPFKTPYSKPPVCMYSNIYVSYLTVITPSKAGVSLTRYSDDSTPVPWMATGPFPGLFNQLVAMFCVGEIPSQNSFKTADQFSNVASYIGLPSFWTVFNADFDDNLAMGASLMVCTWNATDHALVGCDSSDHSYGGVANMDIRNAELEVLGTVLTVSFIKIYAKVPHCFLSFNQLKDYPTMLKVYSNVTRNSVSFRRYVDDIIIQWNGTEHVIHSRFTLLCIGAMAWTA